MKQLRTFFQELKMLTIVRMMKSIYSFTPKNEDGMELRSLIDAYFKYMLIKKTNPQSNGE